MVATTASATARDRRHPQSQRSTPQEQPPQQPFHWSRAWKLGLVVSIVIITASISSYFIIRSTRSSPPTPPTPPSPAPTISMMNDDNIFPPTISPEPSGACCEEDETEAPSVAPSVFVNAATQTGAIQLHQLFLELSDPAALNDPEAPQNHARQWMYSSPVEWNILMTPEAEGGGRIRATQRYVLATLYFATGGDNWTSPSGSVLFVSHNDHECLWMGIGCWKDKSIKGLDLDQHNLRGTLVPELAHLTSLMGISFFKNSLEGTVPPELFRANLSNLELLDLSDNLFTGTLPPELWTLPSAKSVYVSGNRFSGPIPDVPPISGGGHTSGSDGDEAGGFATDGNNSNIFLSNDTTTETTMPTVLSPLQTIWLQNNSFTGSIPDSIGDSFGDTLVTLLLNLNELTSTIPSSLMRLTQLTYFDASSNQLSGSLPRGWHNLTKLHTLLLHHNALTGRIDADSITWPPTLKWFYLNSNEFTGGLPQLLSSAMSLERLVLDSNALTGELSQLLSSSTSSSSSSSPTTIMHNLTTLSLRTNRLSGPLHFGPLSSMDTVFPALEWLSLANNSLSGELPPVIAWPRALQKLYVSSNQFTGVLDDAFFFVGTHTTTKTPRQKATTTTELPPSMTRLALQNNRLEGSIPSIFCQDPLYKETLVIQVVNGDCSASVGDGGSDEAQSGDDDDDDDDDAYVVECQCCSTICD